MVRRMIESRLMPRRASWRPSASRSSSWPLRRREFAWSMSAREILASNMLNAEIVFIDVLFGETNRLGHDHGFRIGFAQRDFAETRDFHAIGHLFSIDHKFGERNRQTAERARVPEVEGLQDAVLDVRTHFVWRGISDDGDF